MADSVTDQQARAVPGTQTPCFVFPTGTEVSRYVARMAADLIRQRNLIGQSAVLGLSTGSTPIGVYRELVRMHREEGLDFSNVVAINLHEFYGIQPDQLQSYHRWMNEQLFNHINIPRHQIHIPDGTIPPNEIENYCRHYERQIDDVGGMNLLIMGLGRNGHIGFNEPFSLRGSGTRLCVLDPVTRRDVASDFFGEANVPTHAITVGMQAILKADRIVLMAMGEHKADIIRETVEGPVTDRVPASFLREHDDTTVLVDEGAASKLTAIATPWRCGPITWTEPKIKRAILWLCEKTEKALLKLDGDDFRRHDLHQLLRHHGPADQLAHRVFRWMMGTIDYHPAGRKRKKVICFSPHPDDDVISMGGTLIRLNDDGHEVHIAYMTSGNIAVFDHDAQRVADLVTQYNHIFDIDQQKSQDVEGQVRDSLATKLPGQQDIEAVQKIKALIRWGEARAGALKVGCCEEHLHFLDLPFYRTGTITKKPVGDADVQIVRELLQRVAPDQVYMAGDLTDPHGTHRVCAEAIIRAVKENEQAGITAPDLLMYRGAWQEYELHQIEIAVPLSPGDMALKRRAIFMHESQKDEALFPGSDPREFWQRAEDRNTGTAALYNQIGLPEYYALEGFVRWRGQDV